MLFHPASWCWWIFMPPGVAPCKTMHPVLLELKQHLGEQIRILKIDVDKYQNTAAEYRIQSVPTLMLFRNGQMLWRQSGALPLNALLQQVQAHL